MSEVLRVRSPERRKDADELIELLAKTFSRGWGYWKGAEMCRQGYLLKSHYDWEASRVGLHGGRILTHFGVWPLSMRVGRGVLKVAGIGAVATHDAYRGVGLMRKTAKKCLSGLGDAGYDLSLLFGISDFYWKFGYVKLFPRRSLVVKRAHLGEGATEGPVTLQKRVARANEAMDLLFNKHHVGMTGSVVRPSYPLRNPLVEHDAYWISDGGGERAYFLGRSQDEVLRVNEVAGDGVLLRRGIYRVAEKLHCHRIEFRRPFLRDPFVQELMEGDCELEESHEKNGGALARVIDVERALKKLRAELQERLSAVCWETFGGEERLTMSDGGVSAACLCVSDGGKLRIDGVPGEEKDADIAGAGLISQLILGSDDPARLLRNSRIAQDGRKLLLAKVMFPAQAPNLPLWDGM